MNPRHTKPAVWIAALTTVCTWAMAGCAEDPPPSPGDFGEVTTAVVILNPVINAGSTTSVTSGPTRDGIAVRAGDLPESRTDDTGLALIEGLPTGTVPFLVGGGSAPVQVVQERELYDVVLAWDGNDEVTHVIPPVRYPIGGEVKELAPGADLAAAATDDSILFLEAGTYPGNFELTSENVLIFGAWSAEEGPLSIIEGNVTVRGGGNRMRGVQITGELTSNANGFSAAFSRFGSANITGNDVSLLRNTFTSGSATVPSSSAVLVDNVGIP